MERSTLPGDGRLLAPRAPGSAPLVRARRDLEISKHDHRQECSKHDADDRAPVNARLQPQTYCALPFVWLTLLPFALYGSVGVWTVPVVIGIAAVLCGIEEIGVQCEEPFG